MLGQPTCTLYNAKVLTKVCCLNVLVYKLFVGTLRCWTACCAHHHLCCFRLLRQGSCSFSHLLISCWINPSSLHPCWHLLLLLHGTRWNQWCTEPCWSWHWQIPGSLGCHEDALMSWLPSMEVESLLEEDVGSPRPGSNAVEPLLASCWVLALRCTPSRWWGPGTIHVEFQSPVEWAQVCCNAEQNLVANLLHWQSSGECCLQWCWPQCSTVGRLKTHPLSSWENGQPQLPLVFPCCTLCWRGWLCHFRCVSSVGRCWCTMQAIWLVASCCSQCATLWRGRTCCQLLWSVLDSWWVCPIEDTSCCL